MQDFYFKVQINIASVSADAEHMQKQVEKALWDYFNDNLCLMTDVEVETLTKKEYFQL